MTDSLVDEIHVDPEITAEIFREVLRFVYTGDGGVPSNSKDIGDGSVIHILIEGGAHHQDLRFGSKEDPTTVTQAKKQELNIIMGWL